MDDHTSDDIAALRRAAIALDRGETPNTDDAMWLLHSMWLNTCRQAVRDMPESMAYSFTLDANSRLRSLLVTAE
jgi:hypothetical protein